MKLKKFIEKLQKIAKDHNNDLEVVMADDIAVVDPIFSSKYSGGKVVITDQN